MEQRLSSLIPVGIRAAGGAGREQRRNRVARTLAALDLMRIQQIRLYAETAGIALPWTEDRKALIEEIRLFLMAQAARRRP
ncbi:MAG: hypothetical protein ACRDYA_04070 [Egibacteraceae bacterium]